MADKKMAVQQDISPQEAVAWFEREHKDKPADALAHFNLGSAYYITGDWENARKEFEDALAANPGNDHARYYLGVIHAKKGDKVKARAEWEKVANGGAHGMLKNQARIQLQGLG
ncbi:MAG: tetratricopeptide repeat protein [Chloroflexi bacterium]|nr:tetratricopeptide repeat protein [Chloroflexota bacterium]